MNHSLRDHLRVALVSVLVVFGGVLIREAAGQTRSSYQVEVAWNRFHDYDEIVELCRRIEAGFPDFVTLSFIGKSVEGRELPLLTVFNPRTGPEMGKAALWVEGNIHGNEVQGAEASLYTVWYLLEHHGEVEQATRLLDERVFYIFPMVNPDGRAHWFGEANTSSSSRSGTRPTDNDGDGLLDEDGYDDLNGDGEIQQMRKHVPGRGTHREDPETPGRMERVPAGEQGDYLLLGTEGIDNDGDGQINEDGIGGYDMNRNFPSGWMPNYIQGGAGEYPFSFPECRAVGEFILAHPNIAGVQDFHNAGGMLLRGPGNADYGEYPAADRSVYDEMGKNGELILPFYRYMIIHKDLYTVYGGMVNWTYEGLGIVSFTNELWSSQQYFNDIDGAPGGDEGRRFFDKHLLLGAMLSPWQPYDHPLYGAVEIGGWKKMTGRVPPSFLIEEMLHRNAAFCWYHADSMPKVELVDPVVEPLGAELYAVELTIRNPALIPTRTALAADKHVGRPDVLSLEGDDVEVIRAAWVTDRFRKHEAERIDDPTPQHLRVEDGIGSKDQRTIRWIVRGKGHIRMSYAAEKAGRAEIAAQLR